MSRVIVTESHLTDIADAIRSRTGTQTTYAPGQMAAAVAALPNAYAAADEGKVVSNGALVAQGSDTATENGTVDTTLISSLTVNVSGGGGAVFAFAHVFYAPGGTCTATDGTRTLTAPDTTGEWVAALPASGSWTFTCGAASSTVLVDTYGISVGVYMVVLADVNAFSGRVVVKEVWNPSYTYKALKWYFVGVSVTSTSGNSFSEPLLSLRPSGNRPNGHSWNSLCYGSDKTTVVSHLCIMNGVLKDITTNHASWITGNGLYAVLYTAHPNDSSSFVETDFTTLGGPENDTQMNAYEEP